MSAAAAIVLTLIAVIAVALYIRDRVNGDEG